MELHIPLDRSGLAPAKRWSAGFATVGLVVAVAAGATNVDLGVVPWWALLVGGLVMVAVGAKLLVGLTVGRSGPDAVWSEDGTLVLHGYWGKAARTSADNVAEVTETMSTAAWLERFTPARSSGGSKLLGERAFGVITHESLNAGNSRTVVLGDLVAMDLDEARDAVAAWVEANKGTSTP
ncbi:MAG: hypothetical protein JJT89_02575 [Nitriliruptoraceae bacterium]|nr:hypothetical protein [Nitriliruptoraceae bacterium]